MLRISVTKIFLWDHFFYMECVFETFGKLKNVFSIDTVILPEFLFAWLNFLTHLRWQERAQKHTNSQGWGSDSWLRTNIAYEACFSLCIFGCLLSSFYVTRLLQAHGGWNVNITTPCRTEVTLQDKLVMSTWHNAALCCCTKLALRTRSVALWANTVCDRGSLVMQAGAKQPQAGTLRVCVAMILLPTVWLILFTSLPLITEDSRCAYVLSTLLVDSSAGIVQECFRNVILWIHGLCSSRLQCMALASMNRPADWSFFPSSPSCKVQKNIVCFKQCLLLLYH